jgi:hypothetical protein
MPKFTTSVNLLAASEADIEKLNEAMKMKSFHVADGRSMKDQAAKGSVAYSSTTKASLAQACTDVSMAASSVGRKFSFTVIKEK